MSKPGQSHRVRRGSSFWERVDKSGECWTWIGARTTHGYGEFRGQYAHRLSWAEANGAVPKGLFVLHRCDNPPCVRPDHLYAGTVRDNARDAVERGQHRRGTRCSYAKLTEVQVLEVRRLIAAGQSNPQIAAVFGVTRAAIRDIRVGRNWGWLRENDGTLGLLRAS